VNASIKDSFAIGARGRVTAAQITRCVHIVKQSEDPPILNTASVPNCPVLATLEVDHIGIAQARQASSDLRSDAVRIAPGLFGLEPEATEATKTCKPGSTKASCEAKPACTWENAGCEARVPR
jgi:hypothetical protein